MEQFHGYGRALLSFFLIFIIILCEHNTVLDKIYSNNLYGVGIQGIGYKYTEVKIIDATMNSY